LVAMMIPYDSRMVLTTSSDDVLIIIYF
jgi:hypothetical protein